MAIFLLVYAFLICNFFNLLGKVKVSYSRYKHWFQYDIPTIEPKSTVVVAMFRDPYGEEVVSTRIKRCNILFDSFVFSCDFYKTGWKLCMNALITHIHT